VFCPIEKSHLVSQIYIQRIEVEESKLEKEGIEKKKRVKKQGEGKQGLKIRKWVLQVRNEGLTGEGERRDLGRTRSKLANEKIVGTSTRAKDGIR